MTLQPYTSIPQVYEGQVKAQPLTQREYEALRDAMPTTRDQLIAKVLRGTGWRIGEILRCPVEGLGFNGPEAGLYLSRSKKRTVKRKYELVPLPPGLGVLLRDYTKGLGKRPGDPIFDVSVRQVERVFVTAGIRALGRRVHPHELRGVYATFLIDNGVPVAVVANLLGHADIKTTLEHYHKLNAEKIAEIQRRIPV